MRDYLCASLLALAAGYGLDLLIGDPKGWPHLIRLFGWVIRRLERLLYPCGDKRLAGALLVALTLLACGGLPALALLAAWRAAPWLYLLLESLMCWQLLATRSLRDESLPVFSALQRGDPDAARQALSMIVGRDTARLDEAGMIRAAVETVAENTADGVAAPLFYMALGGAALGCVFKAVNTMDSMVGYRNDRYLLFGRCAARVDDVFNYVPARLCALAMITVSAPCGLSARQAWRIWRRDRRRHASPNSAQTEAVMAGALGVQLAGDAWYFGKLHRKPAIGDARRPIERRDILRAHRLLWAASALLFALAMCMRGVLCAAL